ncbi:MAG: acetaldehyde dehydrogenase (acetylating), partial [Bacteroidota bacterium]
MKKKVAIIGSGNIGTDLMIKIIRTSEVLEMGCFVGIDAASDGLARAQRMGVDICATGIDGLIKMPIWKEIEVVFDATSAKAHLYNFGKMEAYPKKKMVDLTPAAIGPYFVPAVNGDSSLSEKLGLTVD